MSDFFAAIGLVFAIEGLMFAAFPKGTKRAIVAALAVPDSQLRIVGIVSAAIGVVIVWLMRG
jgi:uncharacterized protein YjeT (DUF2065 family)